MGRLPWISWVDPVLIIGVITGRRQGDQSEKKGDVKTEPEVERRALVMKEGATKYKMQGSSRSWRRQRNEFLP